MYLSVIRDDFNSNVIDMTFMVTNKCNYTCTYCIEKIPYLNNNDIHQLDLEKAINFIYNYIAQYPTNTINIRIYGGEPTLHPQLLDFCEKLNIIDKINIIEIFTNFSAKIELYSNLLKLKKLHLFTSYHSNNMMSDLQYIEKLLKFNAIYSHKIVSNIMLENEQNDSFNTTYNLYKKLIKLWKNKNYNTIRTELIPLFSTNNYISQYKKNNYNLLEIINNLNNEKLSFTLEDENHNLITEYKVVGYDSYNFQGWQCTSGINAIFVDILGDVYPCGGLYTKRKDIYKYKMKNIFINNIDEILQYTICPHNDCVLCVPMNVKNINNINIDINLIKNKFNKI